MVQKDEEGLISIAHCRETHEEESSTCSILACVLDSRAETAVQHVAPVRSNFTALDGASAWLSGGDFQFKAWVTAVDALSAAVIREGIRKDIFQGHVPTPRSCSHSRDIPDLTFPILQRVDIFEMQKIALENVGVDLILVRFDRMGPVTAFASSRYCCNSAARFWETVWVWNNAPSRGTNVKARTTREDSRWAIFSQMPVSGKGEGCAPDKFGRDGSKAKDYYKVFRI